MDALVAVSSPRHLHVVGGVAAWHIPLVATTLGLGAFGLGLPELAAAVAVLGFLGQSLLRGVVVEVAPRGLTRGFILNRRFLGRTTVMAWHAVKSVHTDWRLPGDDTALATTVRDDQGRAIHFTTAMGLSAYWACLGAVVAGAPGACRSGLTDAVLASGPPGARNVVSAAATAGALAIVIVALAVMHYLWAEGRSSLGRSLEQGGLPGQSALPER